MNNELGWTGTDKAGGREVRAQNTGRCREKDEGTEWRGAKTDGKFRGRAGEGVVPVCTHTASACVRTDTGS